MSAAPRRRRTRKRREPLLDRSWPWIVRFVGLGLGIWETVFEHVDRPSVAALAAALILGPNVIRTERGRNDG